MQTITLQKQCAFPGCTNSFALLRPKKKYCCGCCRVKDFNRRKRQQETLITAPAASREVTKDKQEIVGMGMGTMPTLPTPMPAAEPASKGMSMAGVGESAVGTAGVLLLKDQLFDKAHRNQLQQQLNQLLQQQSWIYSQILAIHTKIEQLSKR
ncbi:hypothetical protein D770_11330 [Flammeovirgaceae bacterium 311]|nr:hypothetical protein D770_11330 [Flammeovirgaceae bacterium 311]